MTDTDALAEVDAIFDRFFDRGLVPGVAYGVVIDGRLVATGGRGTLRDGVDAPPDADSVFRIASMTKSFTAAAVVLLRDEGKLRLDDPVEAWVPELAGRLRPTADSRPVTIDDLLTMSAGFPTDDPWGDRQQGLALDRFAEFLRGGVGFAWAPGTRFEYSNLAYGILGRVVTNATGTEYRDFVRERLLAPLGMTATTYDRDDVPDDRLARGYVRRDDVWLEEPIDPYGALAAMGGIFTTVRDLSRWVAGFLDAFPPRDDPDGTHPLTRASRREMQQVHRVVGPKLSWTSAEAGPQLDSEGYGYGLSVFDDLRFGRFVAHGGGYPGFGSHMRWHPASGIGIVAFGNARYGPVIFAAREAFATLLERHAARIRPVAPWPETLAAKAAVEALLAAWDEAAASALFSMNVELDEPIERRRAEMERIRERHGPLVADGSVAAVGETPAHLAWWLRGASGRVRVEILLSPERPPLVQGLKLLSVPEPPEALAAIARRLAESLGEPGPGWPDDLVLAAALDPRTVGRALRATEARFGPVTLGPAIDGDGETRARWRLSGERGEFDLELERDGATGGLTKVGFVPVTLVVPGATY